MTRPISCAYTLAMVLLPLLSAQGKTKPPNHADAPLNPARIGIPRAFFYDHVSPPLTLPPATPRPGSSSGAPGQDGGGDLTPEQARGMTEAIAVLEQQGAVIVDPADIPCIVTKDFDHNFLAWSTCGGWNGAKGRDANC